MTKIIHFCKKNVNLNDIIDHSLKDSKSIIITLKKTHQKAHNNWKTVNQTA